MIYPAWLPCRGCYLSGRNQKNQPARNIKNSRSHAILVPTLQRGNEGTSPKHKNQMESTDQTLFQPGAEISPLLVHLLKGVLYREQHPDLWSDMLRYMGQVREYFALIGLEVYIDEAEGYGFLRQVETGEDDDGGETVRLPRLVQRRQLSYPVSLLIVLLRKKLVEFDAGGGETRLIISRDQIIEMMRVFLAETSNEAKLVNQIDRHTNKLIEFGFLRKLKNDEYKYEIHRIIKALVDGQWLSDFDKKLQQYHDHAADSP